MSDPGDVKIIARASVPPGWLLCDGTAVPRLAYADLFTAIGTAFGEGDGSTTFNLPDFRGRTPVGYLPGSSTQAVLGSFLGGIDQPLHAHDLECEDVAPTTEPSNIIEVQSGEGAIVAAPNHTHSVDIMANARVSSGAHPMLIVNYIIKF